MGDRARKSQLSGDRNVMKSTRWVLVLLLAIAPGASLAQAPSGRSDEAFQANKKLGRGINLGNALEAPSEGEWGLTLKAEYFDRIKEAGFQSVRIPIRWATHTGPGPEFAVDRTYFDRVDWAIDQALSRGLVAIINAHHDEALYKEPAKHEARLQATWRKIATRYKDRPDQLFFELLNEPHGALTDEAWQAMFPKLLEIVRESNPKRPVIIGPGHWNNVDSLKTLQLPEADRMLIATFHYYSPFHFTHQGAEWAEGSQAWKGETWTGTSDQQVALKRDFEKASKWSNANNRPVFLGEFGAYQAAPMDSRVTWTSSVAREAERLGFSWSYWEFAAGFGIFDKDAGRWRTPLKDALVPPEAKKGVP
jgi:endoglucanase